MKKLWLTRSINFTVKRNIIKGGKKLKKIAIIPARSGSKGLKNKNILELNSIPLLGYTVTAAIKSDCFDRVIVSSDSFEYGKIAESFGAEFFQRSDVLASDSATSFMVIDDILQNIETKFDYFALLQPTSPLRNQIHIREAVDLFEKNYKNFNFVVSVQEVDHSVDLIKPIDSDCSLKYFNSDFSNYHRQGVKCYSPNGAIFLGKPLAYEKQKHFFGKKSLAYFMSKKDSIDIDDKLDFMMAEALLKKL